MRPMHVVWPCCSPATGSSAIEQEGPTLVPFVYLRYSRRNVRSSIQAVLGTRHPTHQIPMMAMMAMVV